jgi:hypothetical protein
MALGGLAEDEPPDDEVTLGLDVTGLLRLMHALPGGAGTARFLAGYRQQAGVTGQGPA